MAISYKFKGTDKVVTKELFKVGSSFPATKSITFENKTGGLDLMVHYSNDAKMPEGLPPQIAQYDITDGKKEDKTEKFSFTMRVSNNIHNVACLDEVEFIQEWKEQEKIPVKASPVTVPPPKKEEEKKEGDQPAAEGEQKPEEPPQVIQPEQQYEIKERHKKSSSQIKFTTSNFALAPKQRRDFHDFENAMCHQDSEILDLKQSKNNLEAYSYEMRNNLDSYGSLEKYLDEATRATFLAEINKVVEWIYGEGENAPLDEYKKKLEHFKKIGEPTKARHFYYSELELYFTQFDELKKAIVARVPATEHITEEQASSIMNKVETAEKLFSGVRKDRESKQLH